MAEYALVNAPYPGVNTAYKRGVLLQVVVSIASGAPSIVTARSAPGFTVADGATGAYTGTAPKAARGVFWTQVVRAAADDAATVDVTSYDPTTGAFALQAYVNDAASDLPDGAELWLVFFLEGG